MTRPRVTKALSFGEFIKREFQKSDASLLFDTNRTLNLYFKFEIISQEIGLFLFSVLCENLNLNKT